FSPEVNSQPDAVSNFFPVRAGHVRITHLYITDAFGQVQKIIDTTNNNEAKEMITAAKGTVYTGVNLAAGERVSDPFTFRLSPRIIQPSRLLFRWMNAAADTFEESTTDPATTPLCGWVLPDFLSRSLVIYDASGKGCGSVSVLNNKISWQAMPGADNAATPAGSINNRFLLDFVNGLLNNSSNTKDKLLTDFFDLCIGRANYISSSSSNHYPGIAGLTGQPLALVRAALKFELLGLPAQPQNWTEGYSPEIKDTPTGLAGIQFPVSLGDTRNSKDGLIGYYTDAGFDNMRVSFGSDLKDKNSYFVKEDIALSFSPGERQTGLTLLIDPRGGVQADCGILPSKYIDLPAVYKEDSVKNIALHLLVAPFLSLPDAPEIPVSTEQGSHWLLLQNKAGNRINT
ncbi:MAG: hypothetical protein JWQ38_1494, partial [Flavipsychrobacter sp.]|nr:hypothetical protein [Flavipsychrobacter sp.]